MNYVPLKHRSLGALQLQSESVRLKKLFGIDVGHHGRINRLSVGNWEPKTCQWLEGEARERNFCCATVKPGSSYCTDHHARCFVPFTK